MGFRRRARDAEEPRRLTAPASMVGASPTMTRGRRELRTLLRWTRWAPPSWPGLALGLTLGLARPSTPRRQARRSRGKPLFGNAILGVSLTKSETKHRLIPMSQKISHIAPGPSARSPIGARPHGIARRRLSGPPGGRRRVTRRYPPRWGPVFARSEATRRSRPSGCLRLNRRILARNVLKPGGLWIATLGSR